MFGYLFVLFLGQPAGFAEAFAGLDAVIVDVFDDEFADDDERYGEEHAGGAEKLAAWTWDNIPGGTATQLWIWRWCEPLALYCEDAANLRDRIGRTRA